jgi:hypothetical protein
VIYYHHQGLGAAIDSGDSLLLHDVLVETKKKRDTRQDEVSASDVMIESNHPLVVTPLLFCSTTNIKSASGRVPTVTRI